MAPGSSSLISSSTSGSPPMSVKGFSSPTTRGSRDGKPKDNPSEGKAYTKTSPKSVGKSSPAKSGSSGFRASSGKKSPVSKGKVSTTVKKAPEKMSKGHVSTSESEPEDTEVTFEGYSELCERVAKTMYYVKSRPPTTPRPSLPLTILAVDTFSKFARKDTLEFLDIDMAAEIGRNACVSPTALVFALVYLERLSVNNPGYLKTVKPSELFVVSLLVASKFVQDDGEDLGIFNDEWATSANMELKKINKLELEFLTAIDWHINIGKDEYERALKNTEEKMALYQGAKRGWFTYTELQSLTNSHLVWKAILPILYERIAEVVSGICVMYTTFFATLITSSVLAPYLLSVSKLVLVSSITNSFLTGSSLSSCSEDISSSPNASLSLSQDLVHLHVQNTIPHVPGYVPAAETLLASLEEEENNTELSSTNNLMENLGAPLRHQVNNVLLHHNRRGYETGNANFGYSFKCESSYCHDYSQDEALQKVQQVLENLLLHSNNENTMPKDHFVETQNKNQNFETSAANFHCERHGLCPVY